VKLLDKAIKEQKKELESCNDMLQKLLKVKELENKRLREGKLSIDDVVEIMKINCWGSIAHCCSFEKGCPLFLASCEALGIDPKEFSIWKEVQTIEYLMERKVIE
jgi:predicted metal-binding transcription factor (methanogenesis marker protein 9)